MIQENLEHAYGADLSLSSTALDADGSSATGASMRLDIGRGHSAAALLSLTTAAYGTEDPAGTWLFNVGRTVLTDALAEGVVYHYTLWTITSDAREVVRAYGSFTLTATVS